MIITINQQVDFCCEKWGEDWTWDEGSTIKEKMNYARKEIARKQIARNEIAIKEIGEEIARKEIARKKVREEIARKEIALKEMKEKQADGDEKKKKKIKLIKKE